METEILEIITQFLMEDRLEKLAENNEKYQKYVKIEEEIYNRFKSILSAEQQEKFDDFLSVKLDTEIVLEKTAYLLGLRDMYTLVKALSM